MLIKLKNVKCWVWHWHKTVASHGECPRNNECIPPKSMFLRPPFSLPYTPNQPPRQPHLRPTSHRTFSVLIPWLVFAATRMTDWQMDLSYIIVWYWVHVVTWWNVFSYLCWHLPGWKGNIVINRSVIVYYCSSFLYAVTIECDVTDTSSCAFLMSLFWRLLVT